MGKTRLDELFYELYASSRRHDSWQRQAMIRELRNLLKQPLSMKMKGNRSDSMVNKIGIPEDQVLNDEELGETEVATDSIETEHETVNLVPEAPEEESIPQVQVPIDNSEIARSIEPGKVDLGLEKEELGLLNENLEQEWDQKNDNKEIEADGDIERDQKMIRDAKICCARKVFGKMPSKEKRIKHLKGWKFKFKRKSLVGIMLQIEQCKLRERRRRMYNKLSTNIKDESMKERIAGNHPRMVRQLHKSGVQCKMRMMNDSWSMRQPTPKIMKPHRKHKWKSKQLQIASNFWIHHSHKLADLVLRSALTDWRTKNSKGLAYDGCVSWEINLAGFGRGKTEMLATSQKMQKMDLFSFGIHTEMEENVELKQLFVAMERFSQEVIEPKMEGGLICGDVKFHLKHKWRFRLLESFPRLVLLAWINLWFSKAYEFSGQLQDSSRGRAESFSIQNFAAGQHLFWMQNNSEKYLIDSEFEKKKKLCYKTWMFKYKVDEEDQGILQSRTEDSLSRREISTLLHQAEALLLPFPGDERFQIKHKWRFKLLLSILELELYLDSLVLITSYAHQFDILSLIILMSVDVSVSSLQSLMDASSLQNLEVKVSSKEGDLLQVYWTWAGSRPIFSSYGP